MNDNVKPFFGYLQPTYGARAVISSYAVGNTKRPKYVAVRTRKIIAANIQARMDARYPNAGDRVKALAEDAGTSLSTIQRAIDPERYAVGITVDVLTQIAMALRCEPDDLLRAREAA